MDKQSMLHFFFITLINATFFSQTLQAVDQLLTSLSSGKIKKNIHHIIYNLSQADTQAILIL